MDRSADSRCSCPALCCIAECWSGDRGVVDGEVRQE